MWSRGSGVAVHRLQSSAQKLWGTGLVAPQNAESSWSRDQTSVPHIGRGGSYSLYHQGSPM